MSWQVAQYPSLAQLVDLGTTYEEKVIQGIRIGRQPKHRDNENGRKRQIVITAGAHGREVRMLRPDMAVLEKEADTSLYCLLLRRSGSLLRQPSTSSHIFSRDHAASSTTFPSSSFLS